MKKYSTDKEWIKQVIDIVIFEIKHNIETFQISENQKEKTSAIFLAWAPGSGKTEFILSILKNSWYFFIDVDSFRNYFQWYTWNNSKDFQRAISKVIDEVMKFCFQNDIRFILDGTFKSLKHVKRNIENCKNKKRKIKIYFIFQNPYVSYYFTFLRQIQNERNIPIDGFIECFYESIRNIFLIKWKDKSIELFICEKLNFTERVILKADYKIRDNFSDITTFCKFYNIEYNADDFSNKELLTSWIKQFYWFLKRFKFLVKIHVWFININRK